MERELSRFSKSHQPTSLQAWFPDNKPSNENKEPLQQIRANMPATKDTDKKQQAVIDSMKETSAKDNNHITEKEYGPGNKLSANLDHDQKEQKEDNLGVTKEDNQIAPVINTLAAVKEAIDEPGKPEETQPQNNYIRDPPVSLGEDIVDAPWVDDEPWEHTFYVGGPYTG